MKTNISLLLKGQPSGSYTSPKFMFANNVASKYIKQKWTKLDEER